MRAAEATEEGRLSRSRPTIRGSTGVSRARVVVEHTISRVKKFNIFGQEFRNRLRNYDAMTDIASGLVNLRILGGTAIHG